MKMVRRFIVVLAVFAASCSAHKKNAHESKIAGYAGSTHSDFMKLSFISVPIQVRLENDTFSLENRYGYGYVVMRSEQLYNLLLDKLFSEQCYGDYLFRFIVEGRNLMVSQEEYEKLKPYLISLEDGDRFVKMNSNKIIKTYSIDQYLPSIDVSAPDYHARCLIHHFFNNGFWVKIDHDSGFLHFVQFKR
ncbi:MAG: hypothetical protein JNL72_01770 [Flavipsychrobacter sp.]|nr:hypothetical protein [Flavipsychrobacter sp.]